MAAVGVGSTNVRLLAFLPIGLTVAAVLAATWSVMIEASSSFMNLLAMQLLGAAPVGRLAYVSVIASMMVAMMLPAALPMLIAYRGLAALDASPRVARTRTMVFAMPYFLVWTASAAAALVVLMSLGLMGSYAGTYRLIPGVVLLAAGVYQFSSAKQYCLRNCQTTTGFLISHWRGGNQGALRMGFDHAGICLGCCWLLMGVVFVSGAMSLFWMAGFTVLVLGEKLSGGGLWVSRGIGAACVAGGLVLVLLA